MNARVIKITLALALALFALTGCSTDNNERSRLVVQATATNGGVPLTIAGVSDNGTPSDGADDYVPTEALDVLFTARPLNDTMEIEEYGPYSTFNVTSYDLTWIPGPNAPAALTDYNITGGALTVSVPVYDDVNAAVLVGPLAMKAEAWFPGSPFTANLVITFHGHDSGSENMVSLEVGTTVQFITAITE